MTAAGGAGSKNRNRSGNRWRLVDDVAGAAVIAGVSVQLVHEPGESFAKLGEPYQEKKRSLEDRPARVNRAVEIEGNLADGGEAFIHWKRICRRLAPAH